MQHRNLYISLAAIATFLITTQPSEAVPIAYDGFQLTFPAYNGGTGFSGPWAKGGFNASAAGYLASDESLLYVNGHGTAGNQGGSEGGNYGNAGLQLSGGSVSGQAFSAINGATRQLSQALGTDNTTIYVSFVMQPRGTLGAGVFNGFFGLTLNGSNGAELFVGKPGGGAVTQYVLESRGGGGQHPSGAPVVIGQTALMVVKLQFLPGADMVTLYVNPSPGGREPVADAVKSDLDLGVVSALGVYSTGAFAIDEIRIGTTYADVVPAANAPAN